MSLHRPIEAAISSSSFHHQSGQGIHGDLFFTIHHHCTQVPGIKLVSSPESPQQSLRGMLTSLSECTLLAVLQRMRDIISFSARSKIFCLSLKDRGVKVLVPQGSSHSVGSRPSDRGGAGGTLKKFFYAA